TGSAPEALDFASISATLDVAIAGTIADVGIIAATATLDGATTIPMTGAANNRIVHHGTAQHEAEINGLTVLGGINPDDPCALARALRSAYLELVAGGAISRTEIAGRSVYFQKGDLSALKAEMDKATAECRAVTGAPLTPSTTPRSRRAIRFNPYL
ncbi:MAG: hypothetical protein KDJ29_20945, partial [Hyphomicrobiales bacterium]|nr:hypothetical protein [Hyphomicrobiales bacterium]